MSGLWAKRRAGAAPARVLPATDSATPHVQSLARLTGPARKALRSTYRRSGKSHPLRLLVLVFHLGTLSELNSPEKSPDTFYRPVLTI